jgi:flagellar protein FlaG
MYDDLRIDSSVEYEKSAKSNESNKTAQTNHNHTNGAKVNLIEKEQNITHEQKFNSQTIEKAVKNTNELMESFHKSYRFKYIEKAERYQVSIINRETGETLKEIPPEEVLKLAEQLQESFSALVDKYS